MNFIEAMRMEGIELKAIDPLCICGHPMTVHKRIYGYEYTCTKCSCFDFSFKDYKAYEEKCEGIKRKWLPIILSDGKEMKI